MMGYTEKQVATIRAAVAEGREAMRLQGKFDPVVFARAFVQHHGVCIPGGSENSQRQRELEASLIESLQRGSPTGNDPTLLREIRRAHAEASWAEAAESESVVGFRLKLTPLAEFHPICRELAKEDHGLGALVFRKGEIVVLPPECDGGTFTPVIEHEVEQ